MKDQDYDFLEILDENEEIEIQYDQLYNDFQKQELIIDEQRKALQEKDNEKSELKKKVEDLEKVVKEKDQIINEFKTRVKKRTRDEFEKGQLESNTNQLIST